MSFFLLGFCIGILPAAVLAFVLACRKNAKSAAGSFDFE